MSKQQTPLQKAIAHCNALIETYEQHSKGEIFKGILTEERKEEYKKAAIDVGIVKEYLQSLLPEEKKFAEDVFTESKRKDPLGNDGVPVWKDFTEYFKQYEDE